MRKKPPDLSKATAAEGTASRLEIQSGAGDSLNEKTGGFIKKVSCFINN